MKQTIEGIDQRKKKIFSSIKNELDIQTESNILSVSDLSLLEENNFPSIEEQEEKLEK